ncbi:MAG: hypothetical protein IBX61_01200 [Thermoleophilia bacterium]|nr:hypothetical protein [Thermoleophilia bacterium]
MVDELNQEYTGKIEVIKYDLTVPENSCEFARYNLEYIPGMLYISKDGRIIEKTNSLMEKEQLRAKLENLLKQ